MNYTLEQFFAFTVLGLCILAAVAWFLCAAVRELFPKGAWYVECPDCGARVRLSRWRWPAHWIYRTDRLWTATVPGCPSNLQLVWKDDAKEITR